MAVDYESLENHVRLEQYKDQAKTIQLLERATQARVSSSGFVLCPFHVEETPSLKVYPDGHWHCYGCSKRGDYFDLTGYLFIGPHYTGEGEDFERVLELIAGLGVIPITPKQKRERIAKVQEEARTVRERLFVLAEDAHKRLREVQEVWESWRISAAVQARHKLGFDGERLTIPGQYRGVVFAIKRRVLPSASGSKLKYISAPGSSAGLFGADLLTEQVPYLVIAEDEKSAMALQSAGVPAIASTGGAGFWKLRNGGKLAFWKRSLYPIPRLIFWRDYDEGSVPYWEPGGEYPERETVRLRDDPTCFYRSLGDKEPKEWQKTRVLAGTHFVELANPGWQAATDFRLHFPRAVIVDSAPFKDAGDALQAGIEPEEVIGRYITSGTN